VALVILELKRIELADYLPSLAFAPLLTWCCGEGKMRLVFRRAGAMLTDLL